jgi:hypothetical protein
MLKIFSLEIQIEKQQKEERSKNWPHKTKKNMENIQVWF